MNNTLRILHNLWIRPLWEKPKETKSYWTSTGPGVGVQTENIFQSDIDKELAKKYPVFAKALETKDKKKIKAVRALLK